MKKGYRNVVFVGFNKNEQKNIKIIDTRRLKHEWDMMATYLYRFPYVLYLENIEEGLKHQGFAIFIKNNDELIKEKDYKRLTKKYYHVILCTEKNKEIKTDAKMEVISIERLFNDKIAQDLKSWYHSYLNEERKRLELSKKIEANPKKGDIALKLKIYFDNKDNVTAKEIAEHFNIPLRTAQRYINYMNDIYENVKYDAKTKTWLRKK